MTAKRFKTLSRNLLLYMCCMLLISSCSSQKEDNKDLQCQFANLLDIKKIPADSYNLDAFGFSDMGAWHAYSLPPEDSTEYYGGFCGPLLMRDNGRWMGKKALQLVLTDDSGTPVEWIKESTAMNYYPGRLQQSLRSSCFRVMQTLVFADQRTSLTTDSVTNISDMEMPFYWHFRSDLFKEHTEITRQVNQVIINMKDSSCFFITMRDNNFNLTIDSSGFTISGREKVILKSGESFTICHAGSYFFSGAEGEGWKEKTAGYLEYPTEVLRENSLRWNGYLQKVFAKGNRYLDTAVYCNLAVKSVETLISNWRSPAGALRHNGLFPSSAYQGFYGFWSWDSWKHAAALSLFDDSLAKESVRAMFDFQDSTGMIADCVYRDPTENNWRDTKPPLAAWAVWRIFVNTSDTAFVKEIFPALEKYHMWWYRYRDHNKNGICEFGSTDGSLIAAKWESGMDNAVRFDKSVIRKNDDGGFSLDQESVDLNTFLQKEKEYLSLLAGVAGRNDKEGLFSEEARKLAERLAVCFWSEKERYFMDFNFERNKFISHYGPEGWLPLWTRLATKDQAEAVMKRMMDQTHFNTPVPLPTLDISDAGFDPAEGYWRGPVWIDQVCFGIAGLRNYGYNSEAELLTFKLFNNARGLLSDSPVRENYHPLTGEGLNAEHFSWSAAHILLLLTE